MAADGDVHRQAPTEPNSKLIELTERLNGKWRVKGPDIDGEAEYRSVRGGLLLVMDVAFVVSGTAMKVIQHVTYDQDTETLRARYMDTMGDESTYTWVLDGQVLRVSEGGKESDTYFEARFNDDDSSTPAPGTIRTALATTRPKSGLPIREFSNETNGRVRCEDSANR